MSSYLTNIAASFARNFNWVRKHNKVNEKRRSRGEGVLVKICTKTSVNVTEYNFPFQLAYIHCVHKNAPPPFIFPITPFFVDTVNNYRNGK